MRVSFVAWLALVLFPLGGGAPLEAQAQSFDCGQAETGTEQAICNTPELTRMDIEAAILYRTLEDAPTATPDLKAKLIHEQEAWLHSTRDACGSDVSCLEEAYRTRIAGLQELIHISLSGSDADQ